MARLHEYQGKKLLADHDFLIPRGGVASTPEQARTIAASLGGPVVLKIQAWTTGRKAIGGVKFAATPGEAEQHAAAMLGMMVGSFPVECVLVEERIDIRNELFVSFSLDDRAREPVLLVSEIGGSGIEERASQVHRIGCDVTGGPRVDEIDAFLAGSSLDVQSQTAIAESLRRVFEVARSHEARSVEINPLVITTDGKVMAADCRLTIDDYAVFRHPDLGIDIARELDHPPTELERIAYKIEESDHRGTFYFAQLNTVSAPSSKGLVGFHGAGGGGSMMSMDAIVAEGFTIANFTDTSGNPSASKVYRAARVILSQPGLCGYFGSGSGVASQEQFWSAYGLAKAFWELNLTIPAVIRVGGNGEDRAVDILHRVAATLPSIVEGYRKDDSPRVIAQRFASLVQASLAAGVGLWQPRRPRVPNYVGACRSVAIKGGYLWIDDVAIDADAAATIASLSMGSMYAEGPMLRPAMEAEEFAKRDSELLACEVEARLAGVPHIFVELDIPGLA